MNVILTLVLLVINSSKKSYFKALLLISCQLIASFVQSPLYLSQEAQGNARKKLFGNSRFFFINISHLPSITVTSSTEKKISSSFLARMKIWCLTPEKINSYFEATGSHYYFCFNIKSLIHVIKGNK